MRISLAQDYARLMIEQAQTEEVVKEASEVAELMRAIKKELRTETRRAFLRDLVASCASCVAK